MRSQAPRGLHIVEMPTPHVMVVPPAPGPQEVVGLCERAACAAASHGIAVCDVRALAGLDLAAVDLLARLQLAAVRAGGRVLVRNASPALRGLLQLVALPVELEREVEQGEPARRVEERGQPEDPAL
ncbi:STAS domain-containing protein [Streptomyces sp. NPDC050560]|uniref:STAS domain-containing protein n=1 Tax=Streptomyces sp. NPDC050560 TaxID=3365630 RepID=UPI0037A50845